MYIEWLTLRDLSDDTDFVGLLAEWMGRVLSVTNCPSFDDHAINSITNSNLCPTHEACSILVAVPTSLRML
ncbi:hypothetical protein BDZ94DRAFT_1277947 [Collybia nuda]|uniref:Uncharacterized protein n=1 Tax=Collybia nuda TaxID=64659 RepID=A0A9P5XRA7_9AGAR|nr:hypothetical protein BDZ94DRAFT_1277947 [Collybia nuda]